MVVRHGGCAEKREDAVKKRKVAKNRLRALVAAMCTLALVMMPVLPAWGDVSSGAMTATNQKNVSVGTNMKRINEFTLDGKYLYKSLGNDDGKPTLTLSTSALQGIVKNTLLPQWSGLAASVFRDQADQLVDLYGYQNNGGTMTQAGFDAYFNMSASGNTKYKDEVWSCYNLHHKLGQTWATHSGDPGWDQFTVSGVKQISDLNDARNMVGQALYDCEGHKGLRADEFVNVSENGNDRLDALKDHPTNGFANLVTSVNCKGASSDFDYVSFGIVFYDFEAVPVAANGLNYIHGPLRVNSNTPLPSISEITNGQQQDIAHSAVLGNSVTETTSTTISALASAKMTENIGANVGWKETQSGSDTEVSDGDDGLNISESGWSEETSMGLNWGASWEIAGALGAEQGHSKSEQISKASETTIAIPAHAASNVKQTISTTTYTQYYQQPVILNYKVALFAVSGDYYTGGDGGINPSSYEKQSLVIKFDTKESANTSYGCAATDDLYSRVVTNRDVSEYDVAGGRTYSTHSTASGWSASKDINWEAVVNYANSKGWGNVGNGGVATTNYFYETPGNLSVKQEKTSSAVDSTYPLYNLASVRPSKTDFILYTNNSLDKKALALEGYDRDGVPFFGFSSNYSQWGEWKLCNENGEVRTDQNLTEDDPVEIKNDELVPKANKSGTIHLVWKFNNQPTTGASWPKTGESNGVQDLSGLNNAPSSEKANPIVHIHVVNSALDAPKVTAQGSYSGFYGTPINLNNVITYEVTDKTDKVIETEVKWESRETQSTGIAVSPNTGYVVFTKPGDYNVRPYVIDNDGEKVYSDWITISATKHDMRHYDAQAPSGCTTDGWKEHYKALDCDKYFTDAEGTNEVSFESLVVKASHDWGDWTDVKQPSGTEAGEQQRVCKKDANHVETRPLYAVEFDMNGHGTAPETQFVASGSSVTVPQEPKAAGFTFEGWYEDADCTQAYDFGKTVESSLVETNAEGHITGYKGTLNLYAKWVPIKYTVATVAVQEAVVEDTESGGQKQVISPVTGASISIAGEANGPVTDEGYTYHYKEAVLDDDVELTLTMPAGYGLKEIQAIPVNSDGSMGTPFVPEKSATNANTYSFKMRAADVAVVASVVETAQVTYDANKPSTASGDVSGMPSSETVNVGSMPAGVDTKPKLSGFDFGGWCTDKACTKPYLKTSPIKENTTLYAKWVQTGSKVTYTLLWDKDAADQSDTGSYSESYVVENGTKVYDPTQDIYSVAGKDLSVAYELKKNDDNKCWFTDSELTTPFDFDTEIQADTVLYAKVVPRTYTVTFFSDEQSVGTQDVVYNTPISEVASNINPVKEGHTLSGWVLKNGAQWSIENDSVTGDLALYASWNINVTFDANGHGTAPAVQTVKSGEKVTKPSDLTAEGYTFGGWYTDATCSDDKAYKFDTPVTEPLTLYAKWTAEKRTVTFDANGHGTAPAAQTVDYNSNAAKPADPTADGYTFGGWYKEAACTTAYDFAAPVTGDLKLYAKWTEVVTPEPIPVDEGVEMYRLYNPNSGEHFYTGNAGERDMLVGVGWSYEGIGWTAPTSSSTPVYRLYNANGGEHHYTMSDVERDMLVGVGWTDEGIGWYSDDAKTVPLYRDYNPNAFANNHNYTTSAAEHEMLMSVGWRPEGYAWYGI